MSQVDFNAVKIEAKRRIHNLVEDYMHVLAAGKKESFNEERVKIAFIVPFLDALGWNPRTDEVLPEQATLTGRADFGLRVGGRTKVFVEMKRFSKSLDGHYTVKGKPRSFAEQAIQYAWGMKASWAVLTNFEEMRLYDSHVKKPEDGLVWKKPIKFTEYESRIDELWLISRQSVVSGALDAYKAKIVRPPVDKAFLEDLINCRQLLADDIKDNNPGLTYDQINESVQKILDRLIFIKNCEDRLIIPAESLWKRYKAWQETAIDKEIVIFMMDLKNLFRYFDQVYNGKLFEKHPCEDLKISNEVFEEIIDTLYGDGQHLGYNFSVIPVDVLGQAYELYIGSIIKEKEGHAKAVEIVKKPAKRKAHGIYYTPEPVVDYIVRGILGKVLEKCKTPEDVSKIKVLDPACGSGSFLIKAFDVIKEWYENYNKLNRPTSVRGTLDGHIVPVPNPEERILTENLYGVDLDPQAVEITILNLSLKAVKTKEKLPYMADHIKCGNSLISGTEKELREYFENPSKVKPFNWEFEFADVFSRGGFDVIIGNPPWVKEISDNERLWMNANYTTIDIEPNTAQLFLEGTIGLVKDGGFIGVILPSMLRLKQNYKSLREYTLNNAKINEILDVGFAFAEVQMPAMILLLERVCDRESIKENKVKVVYTNYSNFEQGQLTPIHINQSWFQSRRQKRFILAPPSLLKKIYSNTIKLGNITDQSKSRRGVEIGKNGYVMRCHYCGLWFPASTKRKRCFHCKRPLGEQVEQEKIISEEKGDKRNVEVLTGDELSRYSLKPGKYINPNLEGLAYKDEEVYAPSRILIRETGDRISATLCDRQVHTLRTIYNIHLKQGEIYDPRYVLGILNSELISYYYNTTIKTERGVFPKIRLAEVANIPVHKVDFSNLVDKSKHDELVKLVDRLLSLNKQLDKLVTDFNRYTTEPIIGYVRLREYYDNLSIDNKEPLDKTSKGKIRTIRAKEKNGWLIFEADSIVKGKKHDYIEVLKCRFEDYLLRKFLFFTVNNYSEPLGSGNVLYKILSTPIPCFDKNPNQNIQIIHRIMEKYLEAIKERDQLERDILETDSSIDETVFKLYGFTKEEASLIRASKD